MEALSTRELHTSNAQGKHPTTDREGANIKGRGTREEKIPSRFYKSGGVFRVFSNTLKIAQFILFKNLK